MSKKFVSKLNPKCEKCDKQEKCFTSVEYTSEGILFNCKVFYDLYCELEERSGLFNNKRSKSEPLLGYPAIVNGSLAVELALKYFILKEQGSFKCIHDLEKLFYNLPTADMHYLSEKLKKEACQNDDTLKLNIKQISNNFEEWRYFFQHSYIGVSGFYSIFVHVVCEYALSFMKKQI